MTVSIPNNVTTVLLTADTSKTPAKTLWIQNFSLTVGFNLNVVPNAGQTAETVTVDADFFLPPGQTIAGVVVPATFFTDEARLVAGRWLARQASGGAVNLNVGRL
jgi:hypothetical protein